MRYFQYFIITLIVFFFIITGCRKERFTEDMGDKLEFSIDTLRFDTVFSERGSATRTIKVFNRHNRSIRIDEITLEGNSSYRINVDGTPTAMIQDVEIAPEDSLYIFAEVEIDPMDTENPFIILDSIRFETNGNTQYVFLEAFGQDANYVGESYRLGVLTCDGGTAVWDDVKPYVVLGFLFVDNCNIIINPGVDIHFQGGISRDTIDGNILNLPNGTMYISETSSLQANGQLGSPVRFLTDRIEPEFEDVPGQWGTIWLAPGSRNNFMNYTEIRNSTIGVRVDSAAELNIHNSTIYETASSALLGVHADITGSNCLIFDISINNVQLEFGGNYHFTHCTFANETNNRYLSHSDPVLRMSNFFIPGRDAEGNAIIWENELNATFENCIFYGTRPDEILLIDPEEVTAGFNYNFNHCLIKKDTLNTDLPYFNNPVLVESTNDFSFLDSREFDYRLDSIINPAIGAGTTMLAFPSPVDLDGVPRGGMPDIGAYEFQE
mgnify:CR=1 FL=1